MKRLQKGFGILGILVLLGVLLGAGAVWQYVLKGEESNTGGNSAEATEFKKSGVLESVDLSGLEGDGPGIYLVRLVNHKVIEVHLAAGEASCDRNAVKIPKIEPDDLVEVNGQIYEGDEVVYVCEKGTYIRASG